MARADDLVPRGIDQLLLPLGLVPPEDEHHGIGLPIDDSDHFVGEHLPTLGPV